LLPAGVDPQRLFDAFLERVLRAVDERRYLPVARFCDGEYSFYAGRETTTCWGEQRSSLRTDGVEKLHTRALRLIGERGLLAPNLNLAYLREQSVLLDFLAQRDMPLSNYVPFYFVYALLVNPRFLGAIAGRRVALITSFRNKNLPAILRT